MQIQDILKAAFKDAGLESSLEILNDSVNNSNELSINTNNDNEFIGEDDLDFSILNSISPPESRSPALLSTTNIPNGLLPDDSDPFLLAIKELDDSKLEANLQQQQNYSNKLIINLNDRQHKQQQPFLKIVSINNNNNNIINDNRNMTTNNSDLLSLLNYRANSLNGHLAGRIPEKTPKQKIYKANNFVRGLPANNTANAYFNQNNLRRINSTTIPTMVRNQHTLVNQIKVVNLSQIQQKNLQDKVSTNHKLIQITNRPISQFNSSFVPPSHHVHQIDNQFNQNNSANIMAAPHTTSNNIKITKVVLSKPLINNSNHNLTNINSYNNNVNISRSTPNNMNQWYFKQS